MSIPSLEDRLRAIEDRLAIYTLIASHPPSADTAAANYTREVYVEDGVFDRGPKLEGAYGVDAIASFTLKPEHKEAIQGGLAHFAGLPLIDLRGDQGLILLKSSGVSYAKRIGAGTQGCGCIVLGATLDDMRDQPRATGSSGGIVTTCLRRQRQQRSTYHGCRSPECKSLHGAEILGDILWG